MARHLRRVYGEGPPAATRPRVDETFASYGRYWAESLRLCLPADVGAGIRYEGFEHIQGAVAAGRGTILAVPHLGGWEWGGAGLA